MPGCGKSTLGRRLAKIRGMSFVDTDTLIERAEKKSLQDIVNRRGVRYLRQLESHVLSNMTVENTVIATGGSAVYSHAAMRHLGANGVVVYLQISLTTLVQRVDNVSRRGLAKMKSHSLPRLYSDRVDLYHANADIIMPNDRPMSALSMGALGLQIDDFFDV